MRPPIFATVLLFVYAFSAWAQEYTIETIAGSRSGSGYFDGTRADAQLDGNGFVVDSNGDILIAGSNHTIRRVGRDGTVTTVAGKAGEHATADGSSANARFYSPNDVALGPDGSLFVVDGWNSTIRRIAPDGVVTTFAGVPGVYGSLDGPRETATFCSPTAVAVNSSGELFVADRCSYDWIRKIALDGTVSTFAGSFYTTGDGVGTNAGFWGLTGLAFASDGTLYVVEASSLVRKVTPDAVVTTIAGAYREDGDADGPGATARFRRPTGIAIDDADNIYVADYGNSTIRRLTTDGETTTIAGVALIPGSVDAIGTAARFRNPSKVACSGDEVIVYDRGNSTLRTILSSGEVQTFAGLAPRVGREDGPLETATFESPYAAVEHPDGSIYVAEDAAHVIRRIAPDGQVTTVAGIAGSYGSEDGGPGVARFEWPRDIAVSSSGDLYVADTGNSTIRKISADGTVSTFAGAVGCGFSDGTGTQAMFCYPSGLAFGPAGYLFVADSNGSRIRSISPEGVVTTYAGSNGDEWTDGPRATAGFSWPASLAFDSANNMYIADAKLSFGGCTIRKISPDGMVTTFAGRAGFPGSADGIGDAARFGRSLAGVAVDGHDDLIVADPNDRFSLIRRVTPERVVSTLFSGSGAVDGTGEVARLGVPANLSTRADGAVLLADRGNRSIRRITRAIDVHPTVTPAQVAVSETAQLGATGTAASWWNWRVIQRPPGSLATLSSHEVRGPTFTPDVRGLYVFLLTARSSTGSRISTVALEATTACGAVSGVAITALGSTAVCSLGSSGVVSSFVDPSEQASVRRYEWAWRAESGGALHSISGADARTYQIKGTDFGGDGQKYLVLVVHTGCASYTSNEIAVRVGNPSVAIQHPTSTIDGGTGYTARVTGMWPDGEYRYWWTITNGRIVSGQDTTEVSFDAGAAGDLRLSVEVTLLSGYCRTTVEKTIEVAPGTGTTCETITLDGAGAASFGDSARMDYYCVSVPAGKERLRVLTRWLDPDNGRVYVKFGSMPTISSFDAYGEQSTSAETEVRLASPQAGTWYIGVIGRSTRTVQARSIGDLFYLITPCRLIDTRSSSYAYYGGPALTASSTRNLHLGGACGIPYEARAVAVNITAVSPDGNGWFEIFPGPASAPRSGTSVLNYRALKTRANNAIVPIGSDRTINIYNSGPSTMNLLIDVSGYFK